MIVIALPAALFVKEPPAAGGAASGARSRWPACCGQPAFYLLALGSMASIGAVGGTMQNLKLYLSLDRGFAQGETRATSSPLILFGQHRGPPAHGLAGRPLAEEARDAARLRDRGRHHPAPGLRAHGQRSCCGGAFLFGIGLGGDYMIIPLMAAELFGLKRAGAPHGHRCSPPTAWPRPWCPWAWPRCATAPAATPPGFLLLVVLAALGAVAVAFLPRTVRPQPGEASPAPAR